MMEDAETIQVLTRSAIKCLQCNTVLESKHRHDYQACYCPNEAAIDGGLDYQRILAKHLHLIEDLSEYTTYDKVEYESLQKEVKVRKDIQDQELLIKLFEGHIV